MHWISTHAAAQITDAMPPSFGSDRLTAKAGYIARPTRGRGRFLPDERIPADGP
jgi:hypothetical protein